MSVNPEMMQMIMKTLSKLDLSKLQGLGQVDSMHVVWKQDDAEDGSVIKLNIECTPVNPNFGETFLEMLRLVGGDKVSISKY